MRVLILAAALCCSMRTASAPAQQATSTRQQADPVIAIRTGALIDGRGGPPVRNAVILVQSQRVTAAGAGVRVPSGARVIDLSRLTVMPGWVDGHTHLTSPVIGEPGWEGDYAVTATSLKALRGAFHAHQALLTGYTTVREVGALFYNDVAVRDAIERGWAVGPRMQVAAHPLGITGGHCDESNAYPHGALRHEPGVAEGIANTVDQVRDAVRHQIKHGAELIKVCATGGVISWGDSVGSQQYLEAELRAAVETAAMLERRVAMHAHGTAGIKAAIRAGATSIEHASLIDDEGIQLMKQHGTYFVTTLMAGAAVVRMANTGELPPALAEKALAVGPAMPRAVARAHAAGVRIALGTDNIFAPQTTNWQEFQLLVEAGLPPMDAIVAGTRTSAELLGWEKDIGTVEAGKYADLVAVEGDPLADITRMSAVRFVMKGGSVVRHDP